MCVFIHICKLMLEKNTTRLGDEGREIGRKGGKGDRKEGREEIGEKG